MVGALLLLLLSRSEKDRQSLVLPGNDDGGYMATAAVVADSTAEATADTAVHTYAAAVQGPVHIQHWTLVVVLSCCT